MAEERESNDGIAPGVPGEARPAARLGPEGHRERLRERFEQGGVEGFLPYEVLELALTYVLPRKDVKDLAKRLLGRFGDVGSVLNARREDLTDVPGVGPKTALYLRFLGDLISWCLREKASQKTVLGSPERVADYLRLTLGTSREERFLVIFLNARNELVGMETLQTGTVNQAVVYPRRVIERALAHNAVALVLVHNHPSGHGDPSPEDVALTARIATAAEAVDLAVHDHLIVTREGTSSLRELGLFPGGR